MPRKREPQPNGLQLVAMVIIGAMIVGSFLDAAQKAQNGGKGRVKKGKPSPTPGGVPAFPGSAWVPYSPMKLAIANRAAALIPKLWQQGEGATLTEQFEGEWITYQAQVHTEQGSKKKAVAAWRLKPPTLEGWLGQQRA